MPVQPAIRPAMGLPEWAMLILLGIIWGGSFFFARVAVAEIPPLTLVLFRVAIAGAALQRHRWCAAVVAGGRMCRVPRAGHPQQRRPILADLHRPDRDRAGLASILNATTPFLTILIANLATTDEKLTGRLIAGLPVVAGIAVMIGPGVVGGGGPVWPKVALLGAAVSYALRLDRGAAVPRGAADLVATGQLTASTLVMIPVAVLASGTAGLFSASPHVWAAVFALALLSTAFAYLLYFTIIARAGATNASLVTLIVPVSAILLGALFLSERLELFDFAGMALIAIGLLTIDGRLLKPRTAARPLSG